MVLAADPVELGQLALTVLARVGCPAHPSSRPTQHRPVLAAAGSNNRYARASAEIAAVILAKNAAGEPFG